MVVSPTSFSIRFYETEIFGLTSHLVQVIEFIIPTANDKQIVN